MRRGEIWTVLADGYARKPRPVVVVQNDEIEGFDSTVVCLMISFMSGLAIAVAGIMTAILAPVAANFLP